MKAKRCSLLGLSLITGLSGCGSHPAQNPKPSPTPVDQTQAAQVVSTSEIDNILVEALDSPSLPIDLAAHPNFVTQGFVIARERYTNFNDHPVKLTPYQNDDSLVLQSQTIFGPTNVSSSSTMPVAISVTYSQGPFDIERISNSVLGSDVELAAGEALIFSWRISPAPGLPLCAEHLGTSMWFNNPGVNSAQGSNLSGVFTSRVSFTDGSIHGELFSDPFPGESIGSVNTTPNGYGTGNCVWLDYINSSPEIYTTEMDRNCIL